MKKKTISKKPISPIKIKTIILSIAIALVLTLFVVYLIQAIYPRPTWDDFCEKNTTKMTSQENQEIINPQPIPGYNMPDYSECQKNYENSLNKYKLIVFIVAVIMGLIAVSFGIVLQLPSVSSGLMLGGTFLVFYGTVIYWSNLNNLFRSLILGIALVILIWLGYKKLKN